MRSPHDTGRVNSTLCERILILYGCGLFDWDLIFRHSAGYNILSFVATASVYIRHAADNLLFLQVVECDDNAP